MPPCKIHQATLPTSHYTPGIEKIVPRNVMYSNDRYDAVTQNQNNCAETHFGGRDMNAFVSPLAAIAQALCSTSGGSTVLRKGTRRF